MTINLADNNPRIAYTVAQGATQQTFAVPFEFFSDSDISVYVDSVLKAEGTDYTLTGGDGSTGNVVFVTATPPDVQQVLGATGGSTVVITRNIPIERTSDFSAGADINRAALNEQLDILTAMIADLKNKVDRSPTLYDYDVVNYQMTIPPTVERSNKYLAFGATGDLVVVSGTTSDIIVSAFGETLIDDANAAAALVTLGLTSTAAEINKLSGATVTTAEINKLAGLATTKVELGYVSGVTSAIQTQLNTKAPLASPALTGIPTAPTAAVGTNTTQLATTAFALANIGIANINIQSFTATGTYTPTSGYKYGIAFVTGAGGGGSTGTGTLAGGGGGGATAIGLLNLTTLGVVTATVGTAGGAGSTGGNSTLSTLTGGGGSGGGSTTTGTGGTATGGAVNIRGGDSAGLSAVGGGGSFWGSGGHFARSYGVGGANGNGGSRTGVSGVIMIIEFK